MNNLRLINGNYTLRRRHLELLNVAKQGKKAGRSWCNFI